ncbi:M6 family metalloprotease domain-containing protein, partial [bacterium]|nr:M6 family metalloprotease domain-containing protein [bacterium]
MFAATSPVSVRPTAVERRLSPQGTGLPHRTSWAIAWASARLTAGIRANPDDDCALNPVTPRRKKVSGGALLVVGLSVLLGAVTALAAPFAEKTQFQQPDGTKIILWGQGDEFYAVFETMDGYTVTFNPATKAYHYATVAVDGSSLVPTVLQVGQGNPAALGLAKHLRISPAAIKKQVQDRFQKWDQGMQVTARWNGIKTAWQQAALDAKGGAIMSPPGFTTTGTKVGLTLLIDFSDDPATIPQASVIDFCNGDSYTGYGNNGPVKKYFSDNSNGSLTYTNVVTIYIRVPQPKTYYNVTTNDCGDQANILIKDALDTMKALPNYATEILPSFGGLTVDGSNRAVAFNVFYAGGNGGVWAKGLWPHSWSLWNVGAQDLGNGKSVFKYQITNIGTSLALGTFCHENGHMLCGYPDIYDYGYDSIGGAGMFCLMNSGGHGANPVQICAYLKRASGWATTVELDNTSNLYAALSASGADFNKFYRYAKPGVPTEYYLLENRQESGRDANLPASGVAIWHIDELGDKDNQSTNYNSSHLNYEVSLMQADNLWHFQNNVNSGDSKDLYYLGNTAGGYNNTFSDASAPSARWWDGSNSGVNVTQFSASGSTMTFTVGNPTTPLLSSDANALMVETCVPTNGAVDPGESVTMSFGIKNTGGGDTINLVATLLSTNGVTVPSAPQNYGVITGGGGTVSQSFSFVANGTCGGTTGPTLQLQDGATDYGTISFTVTLGAGTPASALSENFDGVSAPTLPAGWTTATSGGQSLWVTSTGASHTAPNAAFSPDPGSVGVNELVSPAIAIVSTTAQLTFRHNYNLEATYDGGVLEIKIGAGGFTDIVTAGGSFVSGGYNATISSSYGNPLAGRQAWSGSSGGFATTVVNLPAAAAGQSIQLKWRCGSDSSVSATGWYVDSISLIDNMYACCSGGAGVLAVAPSGGLSASGSVGGPFTPTNQVYALTNSGTASLDWAASKNQNWVSLSATNGTLLTGGSTNVTVSINANADGLAAGEYADTVLFTNLTNGAGSTTRAVSLSVTGTPVLVVSPGTGLAASGPVGGPFSPASQLYTLTNSGTASLSWSVTKSQNWVNLSASSGTLAVGAGTNVTVTITTNANSLAAGEYGDTVLFTNLTNGAGSTTRAVSLSVTATAVLVVSPGPGWSPSGLPGGPFDPSSQLYTLTNTGGASLSWSASVASNWVSLSSSGGSLAAGAATNVTVGITTNANALASRTYAATVLFTNLTSGAGTATRAVALTVLTTTNLWVNPAGGKWETATNWSLGLAPSVVQTLMITNANTKSVTVDAATLGAPGTMTISNLSLWALAGETNTLALADFGTNTPLRVAHSCTVSNGGSLLITNAALEVIGSTEAGSRFRFDGRVQIRADGVLNSPNISVVVGDVTPGDLEINGGALLTHDLRVGESGLAQGAVRLNGGTLTASTARNSILGYSGLGSMTVSNGTFLVGSGLYLGYNAGARGVLTVAGGTTLLNSTVVLANSGPSSTGEVWVTGGQLVIGSWLTIADGGYGQMTVSNGAALLSTVFVGAANLWPGELTLVGGRVSISSALIVGHSGSATGRVVVAGGELAASNAYVNVGSHATGFLTISNGTVTVGDCYVGRSWPSRGTLAMHGGSLTILSNLYVTYSSADSSGTVVQTGGTITANRFTMQPPNTAGAAYTLSAGLLESGGTIVSNSQPFVVGDGTQSATFRRLGGVHEFVDGLVIASNSLLTGCGTVIGAILNYGTVSNECAAGTTILAGTVTNHGTIIVPAGGVLVFGGAVDNDSLIDATAGTIWFSNTVVNTGTILTPPVPPAPTGLTAGLAAGWRVDLAWTDNATTEYGFKLERATAPAGPWTLIADLSADTTTYRDESTVAGPTYYYRVRAYNWTGESDNSAVAEVPVVATSVALLSNLDELAKPPDIRGAIALAAGDEHSLALKSDGTVVSWGYDGYGQARAPLGLAGVIQIATCRTHSLALKGDGT